MVITYSKPTQAFKNHEIPREGVKYKRKLDRILCSTIWVELIVIHHIVFYTCICSNLQDIAIKLLARPQDHTHQTNPMIYFEKKRVIQNTKKVEPTYHFLHSVGHFHNFHVDTRWLKYH